MGAALLRCLCSTVLGNVTADMSVGVKRLMQFMICQIGPLCRTFLSDGVAVVALHSLVACQCGGRCLWPVALGLRFRPSIWSSLKLGCLRQGHCLCARSANKPQNNQCDESVANSLIAPCYSNSIMLLWYIVVQCCLVSHAQWMLFGPPLSDDLCDRQC